MTPVAGVLAAATLVIYGRFGLTAKPTVTVQVTRAVGLRLKVLEFKVGITDRPEIKYPRKLWIVVRNDADVEVVLGPGTSWKPGDLRTRAIAQQVWDLEAADGWHADKWMNKEAGEVRLKPGQAARTWIGLHNDATAHEVETLKGRLGMLIVPVKVFGEEREQLPL